MPPLWDSLRRGFGVLRLSKGMYAPIWGFCMMYRFGVYLDSCPVGFSQKRNMCAFQ